MEWCLVELLQCKRCGGILVGVVSYRTTSVYLVWGYIGIVGVVSYRTTSVYLVWGYIGLVGVVSYRTTSVYLVW